MEKILYREGFTAEELPDEVIERIKGVSYKENPYVKLGDLAYLRVRYYDFELPAKGHTAVTDKGYPATCTTAGKIIKLF